MIEYAITPLGRTLTATVDKLKGWAESHMNDVPQAQRNYDARQS
jgi:DNA-binding HxlR family transcriptional regulator